MRVESPRKISRDSPFITMWAVIILLFILSPVSAKHRDTRSLETVVIDAGHGGKDPGTMLNKAREKDIALAIALRLGNLIHERIPGVKVIYTRSTDDFIPLFERSVIANKNNADLFISIHVNFCATPSIKGTETYVLGLHRTEDNLNVAKKENSAILLEQDYTSRYEGFNPNLSESYIMFELIQDTNIDQSVEFAGILQDSFRQNAKRSSRDVRQAGFLVLRETAMPAVLIETGYLSNKSEANYLMSDIGRKSLAVAIFNSFKTYKEKFDSRLNLKYTEKQQQTKKDEEEITSHSKAAEDINEKHRSVKTEENVAIKDQSTINKSPVSTEKDKITYFVQLCAYPQKLPLNSKLFKGITAITEITVDGYYKYYTLESNSYTEATKNLATVKLKIPDAFIVRFKNGQPIKLKESNKTK
jgi:N-acetylmuramoyl-L-alanine amidase